jgi:hypothetical protein
MGRTMLAYFKEHIRDLAAEYPFAVVLRGMDEPVILIPAAASRSNYEDVRIKESDRIRQMLSAATSDGTLLPALRRMTETAMPCSAPTRLSDKQVLDAAANAVANGLIYAVAGRADTSRIEVQAQAARSSIIDYHHTTRISDGARLDAFLIEKLPDMWCDAYQQMPNGKVEIVHVFDHGYNFLFDIGAERVVAAFGRTTRNRGVRDSARMRNFLGKAKPRSAADLNAIAQLTWRERFFRMYGHKFDRGHFMAHLQGGGLDINLFPQRADINQGQGALGGAYRELERTCAATPGLFVFSRPIYDDESWVPWSLDYGIVFGPGQLRVRTFPNR